MSHLTAIVGVAVWGVGEHERQLQQAAFDDPWYRLGLHLSPLGRTPPEGMPPLHDDLDAVARQFPASTHAIVELLTDLRGADKNGELDLERATWACRRLRWGRCGPEELQKMRRALHEGWR